ATVIDPDGSRITHRAGTLLYARTEVPGLYQVSYEAEDGTTRPGPFEVRSFAAVESVGASQELPVVPPAAVTAGEGSSIREVAPLLLLLVLLFSSIEWLMTHRRRRRATLTDEASRDRPLAGAGEGLR
ncbi:MAG: hypothetical protein OEM97_04510, partial [Acidimicrobiia bacterium]|nr:hypothetical protein [Acidimicrobiia bacterium]